MDDQIIAQNEDQRKAIHMIITGQVTKNGKAGQCFISTEDGLFLATSTACTCGQQDCPHTVAAEMYNDIRQRVTAFLQRHNNEHPMKLFWRLRDYLPSVTDPHRVDLIQMTLRICQQLHAEERKHEINTFYSVCAAGGGAMFSQAPPKRRGRRR